MHMNMSSLVINARNAKRSNAMRKETDTDKVTQQLEAILMESINVQNSDSKNFQVRALKELKQLRSDMITGQINAGSKSNQYVGVYSHVIDQLEEMTASTIETNSGLMDGVGSITNSMPSTDSLVAALMTANPIVGYGVKIMHDLTKSRREAKRQKREEQKQRLSALKGQEEYIKSQLAMQDDQQDVIDGQLKNIDSSGGEDSFGDIHSKLLVEIRDEIKLLEHALKDSEAIIDSHLESVDDHLGDQIDQAADLDSNARRESKLSRLEEPKDDAIPKVENLATNAQSEKKGGIMGMLGGAMGVFRLIAAGFMGFATSIGALFGLGAGGGLLAKMLSPIKSLVGFVFSIGKMVLSIGSKLLLPAAVLLAIFDFFDGFFNADAILGKHDSELTLGDRILVGIANVIARFVKIIDGVLEFFNIDLFDTTDLTKRIYEFFTSIPEMVANIFNSIIGMIKGAFDWYIDKIRYVMSLPGKLFSWYFDTMVKAFTFIVDAAAGAFTFVIDSVKVVIDKVIETFTSIISTAAEVVEWYFNTVKGALMFVVDSVKTVIDKVIGTFKSVYNGIESKLAEWGESLSQIPGIGRFFSVEDEAIKLSPDELARAERDMKSLTSTANLLQVGGGTATMVPLASSGSNSNSQAINGAEWQFGREAPASPNIMVNSPSTVNNSSKTVNSTNNTSNPNSIYRQNHQMNYSAR